MAIYSYMTLILDAIDGLVGFLLIYLPAFSGVILFLGDHTLTPHIASLPISRKELVVGKYLSTYFFGISMVIVVTIITWAVSLFDPKAFLDLNNLISVKGILFSLTPITVIVSVSYPILFKYGLNIGVRIVLGLMAVGYSYGLIMLEDKIKAAMMLDRRGLFPVGMALIDKFESQLGPMFYVLYVLGFVLLIGTSVALSFFWIRNKDI